MDLEVPRSIRGGGTTTTRPLATASAHPADASGPKRVARFRGPTAPCRLAASGASRVGSPNGRCWPFIPARASAPVSSQMQVQAEATAAPTTPIGPTSVIATAVVAAAMVASPVMATVPMAPPAPPSSGVRGCGRAAEGKAGKPRHPNGGGCHRPDRCHCVHAKHGGDRDAADQSAFGAMANGQSRMQQSQSMSCVLNHL